MAFNELISEKITERLKMAMEPTSGSQSAPADQKSDDITTTSEEMEAFRIVHAILREVIDPKKVVMRDAKSYCAILFDDNNRKPICRLRFNSSSKMSLGLFDEKEEKIIQIGDLSDIYKYIDQLKKTTASYIEQN